MFINEFGVDCIESPIIATTHRKCDEPVRKHGQDLSTYVFSGDVRPFYRIKEIVDMFQSKWIWRINADSPLLLSDLIKHACEYIKGLENDDRVKVLTNIAHRSFPYGISLEVYRADYLISIDTEKLQGMAVEHITPVSDMLNSCERVNIDSSQFTNTNYDHTVRLTVDFESDVKFFSRLWEDEHFLKLAPGNFDRLNYAYNQRKKNEG